MSQIDQIRGQPVPAPTYTNDAYMAVFGRFTLRERLGLRLVCHRWKNVIETDCAQMKTLRVFGSKKHMKPFINRISEGQVKPPTAENGIQLDPNANNTIILGRPAYDRVDIDFLARLFSAVENLALTWNFGEFIVASFLNEEGERKKKNSGRIKRHSNVNQSLHEPDIFGLLKRWAPNLRQLYFTTLSYTYQANTCWFDVDNLGRRRCIPFWDCLSLMAPTLEKLTLSGVELATVPQSLVFPSLEELAYYPVYQVPMMNIFESVETYFTEFHARLHQLAPVLGILRMDDDTFCKTQLPSTVTRLALTADCTLEYGEEKSIISCPSVTHLQVQIVKIVCSGADQYVSNLLVYLSRKYPSVKSLKVLDDAELISFLERVGQGKYGHGYSFNYPHGELSPDYCKLYNIEELHLVPEGCLASIDDRSGPGFYNEWNDYETDYKYNHFRVNYKFVFKGIAAVFRGLKRLIFSVAPGKEATHQYYHQRFIDFQAQFLSKVELVFELNIPSFKRERAFSLEVNYTGEPHLCYLSPGCALLGQVGVPEADKSDPKKSKQRTM